MPELVVDSAVLLHMAAPVGAAADALTAVAASLPAPEAGLGPDELVHALENSAHAWRQVLHGAAAALGATHSRLVSAATTYDAVEAVVGDLAGR